MPFAAGWFGYGSYGLYLCCILMLVASYAQARRLLSLQKI